MVTHFYHHLRFQQSMVWNSISVSANNIIKDSSLRLPPSVTNSDTKMLHAEQICLSQIKSILQVHPIWIALLVVQLNKWKMSHIFLAPFLPSFIKKGSNMSTPKFVYGGPSRVLSVGRSAIWLSKFSSKQATFKIHPYQVSKHCVAFDHQKVITSNFIDGHSPSTMCCSSMKPFNYQDCCFAFLPIRTGWLSVKLRFDFFNLPPTLHNPSFSR